MAPQVTDEDHDVTRTGGASAAKPPAGHEERARLLGLSIPQLLGSAGAAVSAAVVASFLGVAGTLIGAAVGSIVSTVSAAVYTKAARTAHDSLPVPRRPGSQVSSAAPGPNRSRSLAGGTSAPDESTYVVTSGKSRTQRTRTVRRLAAGIVTVFALAIGVLTVIELSLGHPVSAQQQQGSTSIGAVVDPAPAPTSTTPSTPTTSTPSQSSTQGTTMQPSEPTATSEDVKPSSPTNTGDLTPSQATEAPAPATQGGVPTPQATAPTN